jgi:hypothetical protein
MLFIGNNLFNNKMLDEQTISIKEALFWLMGLLAFLTFKFLSWVMPKTAEIFWEHLKKIITKETIEEIKELKNNIKNLSENLNAYRNIKHSLEGENLEFKDAIKNDDKEKLETLRKILKDRENEKEI